MQTKKCLAYSIFIYLICFISACSLLEIQKEINIADSVGVIEGQISRDTDAQGPIIVHRSSLEKTEYVVESFARATSEGKYHFNSLPGTYYLAAFIDSNNDGKYQLGEDAGFLKAKNGKPAAVIVKSGKTIQVDPISISGKLHLNGENQSDRQYLNRIKEHIGFKTSLDNPIFARENYSIGMWKPIQFLMQIGGGVFFLEDYNADKIPVLFVHGINGGPLDWKEVIQDLDPKRFQPWMVYYPTGLRLDLVTDYLVQAISRLQDRYHFQQMYVVAHSMGGLVARSYIKKYTDRYPELSACIKLLLTINTPLTGMTSASLGVERSPIVLPVWRDLAHDSPFLKDLNAWPWPKHIPYHLAFSYVNGESSDNVVALQSQIPMTIQNETTRMYGFNDSHTGTLKNDAFLKKFHRILAASAENKSSSQKKASASGL